MYRESHSRDRPPDRRGGRLLRWRDTVWVLQRAPAASLAESGPVTAVAVLGQEKPSRAELAEGSLGCRFGLPSGGDGVTQEAGGLGA